MLDLLSRREEALAAYRSLTDAGVKELATAYFEKPFGRPIPAPVSAR